MTEWDHIEIRKVRDSHAAELSEDPDISREIGACCPESLVCNVPFLVDLSEEENTDIREKEGSREGRISGLKEVVRYSEAEKFPGKLTRNSMVELDGPDVDTEVLTAMNTGACYVDLGQVYYNLGQEDEMVLRTGTEKVSGEGAPFFRKGKGIIDMSRFCEEGARVREWLLLLRGLRPEIPFGIRVPANYIERDCILAATCDIDFIILDCSDTVSRKESSVIPVLAALARVQRILAKLKSEEITVLTGVPPVDSPDYLKLFAMGAGMLLIPGTGVKEAGRAVSGLKQSLYQCGCHTLKEAGKEHLVTDSSVISNYTGIAMTYTPDPVILPFYNLKRNNKARNNKTEKRASFSKG